MEQRSREKTRFDEFRQAGAKLEHEQAEAVRLLRAAGYRDTVPCEMSPGAIWVDGRRYGSPEQALRAHQISSHEQ